MRVTVRTGLFARLVAVACCGLAAGLAAQAPTTKQMHENLALVSEIEYAVVRGDYQGATDPARALSMQTNPRDLPAKGQAYMDHIRTLAGRTAASADVVEASASVAGLVSTCGECHVALGTRVTIATPPRPDAPGRGGMMLHHNWAVSLMTIGLQGPSVESWKRGAEELATARLAPDEAARDLKDAETQLRAIAQKAAQAGDAKARTAVYGELIASCGACHGLLGRVLGPGVPGVPK
jgi:cytochrome c553